MEVLAQLRSADEIRRRLRDLEFDLPGGLVERFASMGGRLMYPDQIVIEVNQAFADYPETDDLIGDLCVFEKLLECLMSEGFPRWLTNAIQGNTKQKIGLNHLFGFVINMVASLQFAVLMKTIVDIWKSGSLEFITDGHGDEQVSEQRIDPTAPTIGRLERVPGTRMSMYPSANLVALDNVDTSSKRTALSTAAEAALDKKGALRPADQIWSLLHQMKSDPLLANGLYHMLSDYGGQMVSARELESLIWINIDPANEYVGQFLTDRDNFDRIVDAMTEDPELAAMTKEFHLMK